MRACFVNAHWLDYVPVHVEGTAGNQGSAGIALKTLSMRMWVKLVLENTTKAANEDVNQPSHLREEAGTFYLVVDEWPCRWRPMHKKPACFATVGALQEAMTWATGKNFRLEGVARISNGASTCV